MITGITSILTTLVFFGGIAGIIAAVGWSRAERIRAEAKAAQVRGTDALPNSVLAELRALKQQVCDMQSTSREFDLSVDDTLSRLEARLNRLEAKAAPPHVIEEDAAQTARMGKG